jgi:hypothetical protein
MKVYTNLRTFSIFTSSPTLRMILKILRARFSSVGFRMAVIDLLRALFLLTRIYSYVFLDPRKVVRFLRILLKKASAEKSKISLSSYGESYSILKRE